MKLFTNLFTQGGQTELHRLHMLRQILGTTFKFSAAVGLCVFMVIVSRELSFNDLMSILSYEWAMLVAEYGHGASLFKNVMFPFPEGKKVVPCLWLARQPTIAHFVSLLWAKIIYGMWWGFWVGIVAFVGTSCYWVRQGEKSKEKKILSGREVVPAEKFVKLMNKRPEGTDYEIGGLPLPRNQELQHIFILGASGTGKTTCIYNILQQIRSRKQRAIIVDATGNLIRKFYRDGKDKILNPFDGRSESWNLWGDCPQDYHYDMVAAAFIPDIPGIKERFWTDAPRSIFITAAKKLKKQGCTSTSKFLDCTIRSDEKEMGEFFKGTIAAPATESRARGDVIFTLSNKIKCMDVLRDTNNPFSIRQWVKEEGEDDWLFLSSPTEMREALQPLISAWLSIATNAIMGLPEMEKEQERRLWFVIDELPSLQRLPSLHTTLAEVRKFGGCALIGVQDIPLLEEIYGFNLVKSIINNCNTQVVLRLNNGDIAATVSRWIGKQEVSEAIENISYGANDFRDSVAINTVIKDKDVVSPSQIMQLSNLEGFLVLPGDVPIGKFKLHHKDIENIAESFVPKLDMPISGTRSGEEGERGIDPKNEETGDLTGMIPVDDGLAVARK